MCEVTERIEAGRRAAALTAPYAAVALASARVVVTDRVPIAGCDTSWRVYWSPDWVRSAPVSHIAWIWLHEVLGHLVQRHGHYVREHGLDPQRANIAQDLAIESWEWQGGRASRPPGGLHPRQYGWETGLAWQAYYDMLSEQSSQGSGGSPDCGSGSTGQAAPWELAPDSEAPSEAEQRAIAAEVAQGIAAARGDTPAGLRVWAEAVLAPPRPDWRRRITAVVFAMRAGYEDQAGAAREKRGILYRRWVEPAPRVAIVADTSGSMHGHGGAVLGAVRDVLRIAGEADVCWVDTTPQWRRYRSGAKIEAVGGGGTDLRPALAQAAKKRYDIVVVITDCDTPWPTAPMRNAIVVTCGPHTPPPGWRHFRGD